MYIVKSVEKRLGPVPANVVNHGLCARSLLARFRARMRLDEEPSPKPQQQASDMKSYISHGRRESSSRTIWRGWKMARVPRRWP